MLSFHYTYNPVLIAHRFERWFDRALTVVPCRHPLRKLKVWLQISTATALLAASFSSRSSAQEAEALPEITVEAPAAAPKQKKYPTPKVAKKPQPEPSETATATPAETSPNATAATEQPAAAPANAIPAIAVTGSVIGDRDGLLDVQGSGHVVDGEQLYTSHVFTTNEALKSVPGLHVRDEEGFGMRPNIGIRGLNPTRSTKTLLLEDGLFLTFAPYGDNASYFHPTMDRFERIEVIKGADQLLYGPQTIAGTVNYVTPNPPLEPGGFAALTAGNREYLNGQVYYGGWYGPFGGQIDYVNKSGDGARDNAEHEVQDLGLKGIVQIDPNQALIGKFSYFKEDSQITYTGLTEAEARNFGIRYNPFENDRFNTERFGTSLTHNWDIVPFLNLASSIYWTSFDRDWWRASSNSLDTFCNAPNHLNDRLNGVAIDVSGCRADGRVRAYETYGLEQRATFETQLADGISNQLKFGYRLHEEKQDRLRIRGATPFARTGPVLEDTNREVHAWSAFVHNKLDFGPFSVTPMVRYENIEYSQLNNLNGSQGEVDITETIPGISFGFAPSKNVLFFMGVHEGFAPPTVADSINGNGGSIDTDAEHSTNFEAGFKSQPLRGITLDGTYFRNDFDNLIASGSVAGNVPLAQGEALFEGAELYARLDSDKLAGTSFNFYGLVAWTWLWTAEQSSPFIRVDNGLPVGGDTTGNRQPYAPEHLVTARIGYAQPGLFDVNLEAVYVGDQYADFLNLKRGSDHPDGPNSNNARSGQFGVIDEQIIFNLGATYTLVEYKTDVFFSVKNLLDEEYIVDRTRGILPGAPRLFQVGLKQNF